MLEKTSLYEWSDIIDLLEKEFDEELVDDFYSFVSYRHWYDSVSNGSVQWFDLDSLIKTINEDIKEYGKITEEDPEDDYDNPNRFLPLVDYLYRVFKEENIPNEIEVLVSW